MIVPDICPYRGTPTPWMREPLPARPESTSTPYGPLPRGIVPHGAPLFTVHRNVYGGVEIVILPADAETVPHFLKRGPRVDLSGYVEAAA